MLRLFFFQGLKKQVKGGLVIIIVLFGAAVLYHG